MTPGTKISHADRLDLGFVPREWPFAAEQRSEIDAYFAGRQRAQPRLWNGRVLMLHEHRIEGGVMHGSFLETDYASFLSWLEWGMPPAGVRDCFGAAAVFSHDGACLLGVMGPHTANAGKVYFPSGTPDSDDVTEDRVDLEFSLTRELKEETGLDAADFAGEPGWTLVEQPSRLVPIRILHAPLDAAELRQRVEAHLARQAEPELSGLVLPRSPDDLSPAMPDFVTAFLRHRWR
jgi:8-oxo-dGTP pyrophosphatase MutT (NUDIX family)